MHYKTTNILIAHFNIKLKSWFIQTLLSGGRAGQGGVKGGGGGGGSVA